MFVIIKVKKCIGHKNLYVLFTFDSSGNVQYERVLDFIKPPGGRTFFNEWSCVATDDGDLIIQNPGEKLYVCDSGGNLKSCLLISEMLPHLACATDQNEIIIHTISDVLLLTKEGEIKRKITVDGFIESVTFNYVTSKIEVLVHKKKLSLGRLSNFILSYSENEEIECLGSCEGRPNTFCSHPAGTTALVFFNKIIYT